MDIKSGKHLDGKELTAAMILREEVCISRAKDFEDGSGIRNIGGHHELGKYQRARPALA